MTAYVQILDHHDMQNNDTICDLFIPGTEIDSDYAAHIADRSNGCLTISTHNLAVAIKKFCTEAFFGSGKKQSKVY